MNQTLKPPAPVLDAAEEAALRRSVAELLAGLLAVPAGSLDEGALLADLGINSVDLIDIVFKLQAAHGVEFDPARMNGLSGRALADNVVAAKLQSRSAVEGRA